MTTQGKRKTLVGKVLSNKMDKTIVVSVERTVQHRFYKKYIRRTSKFQAHDPENICQIGDRVRIIESRPLSRRKRWQLVDVLKTVAK